MRSSTIAKRALPPVSVIMVVYNGARYIAEAIESILRQTHQNFEFIIIDDGSTDQTSEIISHYIAHDQRIRMVSQANQGQVASLNRALTLATNEWVAILDHDDISLPHRLERQLLAVAANPSVRVLGSYAIEINAHGRKIGRLNIGPTSVEHFKTLQQENRLIVLVHPSVMLHRSTVLAVGGYRAIFGAAEDLELWSRMADHHLILALPEPLIYYRLHATSMSFTRFFEGRRSMRWIQARQYARRHGLPEPSLEQHLAIEKQQASWHRLGQLRNDWSHYLSKRAWLAWVVERRFQALLLFTGASVLDPLGVALRLRNRIKRYRSSVARSGHST